MDHNSKRENNLSVSLQTLGQIVKELWDHIHRTHIYQRNMVFIWHACVISFSCSYN